MDYTYRFYEIMGYPIPKPKEFFAFQKKHKTPNTNKATRSEIRAETHKKINIVKSYLPIIKSFPRVYAIYICDGVSFNAAHTGSDIDLFMVVQDDYLRRGRLRSVLITKWHGIKRSFRNKNNKIDLIFYVTQSHRQLEKLRISTQDIYLYYWLAHLIPLYEQEPKDSIYKHNTWVQDGLPNFPLKHIIHRPEIMYQKPNRTAKIIQAIMGHPGGVIREYIIQTIRRPLIRCKGIYRQHTNKEHIISNTILKFHKDKRREVASEFWKDNQ